MEVVDNNMIEVKQLPPIDKLSDRDTHILIKCKDEFDDMILEIEDLNDEDDYMETDGGVYEHYNNLCSLHRGVVSILNKIGKIEKQWELRYGKE